MPKASTTKNLTLTEVDLALIDASIKLLQQQSGKPLASTNIKAGEVVMFTPAAEFGLALTAAALTAYRLYKSGMVGDDPLAKSLKTLGKAVPDSTLEQLIAARNLLEKRLKDSK